MNLLKETERKLKENNKTWKDVLFIGTNYCKISINNFKKVADTEYDASWGSPEVAEDLIIIGKDFYMTRREYDGSEWWDFHKKPDIPNVPEREVFALTIEQAVSNNINVSCGWETLDRLNGWEG